MLSLPIETIIFDLDGTLRHNEPSADDVLFGFVDQLGVDLPADTQLLGLRWAHYYWAQSPELQADIEKFGDVDGLFWVNYSYRYLRSLTVPEERASNLAPDVTRLMEAGFNPENCVYPCIPETLQRLKEANYNLGLVSNRSNPCQEECEQLGLLQYFDFAYVAAEVEAWKPDPRIFDRALELTGSDPGNVIYVGDNYYADIMGAQNAGLQPVLLDSVGVFPDAECAVIKSMGDLLMLLGLDGM